MKPIAIIAIALIALTTVTRAQDTRNLLIISISSNCVY